MLWKRCSPKALLTKSEHWCWYLPGTVKHGQVGRQRNQWSIIQTYQHRLHFIAHQHITGPCLLSHLMMLKHKIQYWQLLSPATKYSSVSHLLKQPFSPFQVPGKWFIRMTVTKHLVLEVQMFTSKCWWKKNYVSTQEVFRIQNLHMLGRNSSAFPLQTMVEIPLYVEVMSHLQLGSDFLLSWTG